MSVAFLEISPYNKLKMYICKKPKKKCRFRDAGKFFFKLNSVILSNFFSIFFCCFHITADAIPSLQFLEKQNNNDRRVLVLEHSILTLMISRVQVQGVLLDYMFLKIYFNNRSNLTIYSFYNSSEFFESYCTAFVGSSTFFLNSQK